MPQSRLVNPLIIVLIIAYVIVIPAFLGINETLSAAVSYLVFCAVSILNPANGVTFIILVIPFFLGEPGWPCFWMLDVLVYSQLLICAGWALTGRWKYSFPLKWPIVLLLAVSVIGLPLNAKESLYNLWAYSWRDALALWVVGAHDPILSYLRVLTNTVSGAFLFIVAHNHFTPLDDKDKKRVFQALAMMAAGVCVAGLLMFYGLVPEYPDRWHYLSLSMVGEHNGAVTGFAFNEQYLVHYLSLTIPLVLYFVTRSGAPWFHGAFYSATLALMIFLSLQAGQRAGLISLAITLALAVPAYVGYVRERGKFPWRVIGFAGILVVVGAGVFFLSRQDILQRLSPEKLLSDPRLALAGVCFRIMGYSPALGGGLGSFYPLYGQFKSVSLDFRPINAHSQYFQIVAEQGLFGVAAWGLFLALCVIVAVRAFKKETSPEKRALMMVPAISLAAWIWLASVNSLFFVRSTEIFFWVFMGMLTSWSAPYLPNIWPGKKTLTAISLIGIVALGYQGWLIRGRQVADGFSTGFYNYERVEGKIDGRWGSWAVYSFVSKKIVNLPLIDITPKLGRGKPPRKRANAVIPPKPAKVVTGPKRVQRISRIRLMPEVFTSGFYDYKRVDVKVDGRWASRRAVMVSDVKGKTAVIQMVALLPGLDKKPQKVRVTAGGERQEVVLPDNNWKEVRFRSKKPIGSNEVFWFEADYALNPKLDGISDDDRYLAVFISDVEWK